ncbi:MAG: IS200/IS605 family transposase [bacterium]
MSDTYSSLYFHCVWSTQNRFPSLTSPFDVKAYGFIGSMVNREGGKILAIGGMPDHVHLLFSIKPSDSVARMMRYVKGGSSKLLKDSHINMKYFAWQKGYGVFSVSRSNIDVVARYIKNQEIHHKERSSESEFAMLLKLHDIKI